MFVLEGIAELVREEVNLQIDCNCID